MKNLKTIAVALLIAALLIVSASCAQSQTTLKQETKKPAEFVVAGISIAPSVVMPSENVTVSATIKNTGQTEGIYTAILTIDGQELGKKDVSVGPDETAAAVFKVTSPATSGDYKLNVGRTSSTLSVFKWTPCTLKYDNQKVDRYTTSWGDSAFLINFVPPSSAFRINNVMIYGYIGGQDLRDWMQRKFTLRLWNKDRSQELWSQSYPYNLFTTGSPDWVKVEVPNTRVNEEFCVEVLANAERMTPDKNDVKCGLWIGQDVSAKDSSLDSAVRGVIQPWPSAWGPKGNTALMVRVEGEGGPKLEQYTLKYDDGGARDCLSAAPPSMTGYLVDFAPPATPFLIKKVRMRGAIYGTGWEGNDFKVEIWDKDHRVLHSAMYPVTKFTKENPNWVQVEVPDLEVSDKFYVHVYTGTGRLKGIHIGADDSVINNHSEVTVREGNVDKIVEKWPYSSDYWFGDKSKVNWMIRVIGTSAVTE